MPTTVSRRDLLAAIDRSGIVSRYQPVVGLDDGRTVGYEALARLRESPDTSVEPLFELAERAGRLGEIEWQCRLAALQGALDAGLGSQLALFVNLEPAAMLAPPPPAAGLIVRRAVDELCIVVELTERHLLTRPAELLSAVATLRRMGIQIALDDVGAHPDSLALLEFVQPDVVKLDLELIQRVPAASRARTLMAVMAYCERTHAQLLAEGIETEEHRIQARALGAGLGQGYLFGHPTPLPAGPHTGRWHRAPVTVTVPRAPSDLVGVDGASRIAPKRLLYALAQDIERQAGNEADPPVVLASFQQAHHFSEATAQRYARLAERCPLVAVFGADLPPEPAPGVRGVALHADDPMLGEWTLVAVGAHYCAALIACDLGDDGPDDERRFEFLLSHDRDIVTAAGRSMLARMIDGPILNSLDTLTGNVHSANNRPPAP